MADKAKVPVPLGFPAVRGEATLSLDDLFLLLFCTLDDLYREVVPDAVRLRSLYLSY